MGRGVHWTTCNGHYHVMDTMGRKMHLYLRTNHGRAKLGFAVVGLLSAQVVATLLAMQCSVLYKHLTLFLQLRRCE